MHTPFGELPDRYVAQMTMAERHEYLVSRRSLLRGALAGAAVTTISPVLWKQAAVAAAPPASGLHLAYGSDPRTTMAVSWLTPASVRRAVVDVGVDRSYGLTVAAEGRAVAGTASVYQHGLVRGLRPATTYQYRVRHAGGAPVTGTFRTAPAANVPFRFTAFGDMGVTDGAADNVARLGQLRPAFHFHVGDLCYANKAGGAAGSSTPVPTDQAVWDDWFHQVAPVAAKVPWMTTVGNHEMENGFGPQGYNGYRARFTLPGGGPRNAPVVYATRYSNVAVIALDANDVSFEIAGNRGYTGGAQDAWLRSTLKRLRADPTIDFIVAGFHHCSYCTNLVHASDGGPRERWGALFDEFSVDLVVNGHNHSYERTHPVKGGLPTTTAPTGGIVNPARDGTTYVTAGGGGQAAYPSTLYPASYVTIDGGVRVPEGADWSAVRYMDLSLLVADVQPRAPGRPATMALTALGKEGQVVDKVTLRR